MNRTVLALTLVVIAGLIGLSTKKMGNDLNSTQETKPVTLLNPGFEGNLDESWNISNLMGATGSGTVSSDNKRSGNYSLKLCKTNSLGYVQLSSKNTVHINPGEIYTLRFRFNSSNAQITSFLITRLVSENTTTAVVSPFSGLWINYDYDSQTLMRNSPTTKPEDWIKRLAFYENKTDKPLDIYIQLMLYGNPFDVYVDDFELVAGKVKGANDPPSPGYNYTVEQVDDILSKRKEEVSSFSAKDGVTHFYSNGREEWPVFYRSTSGRNTSDGNTKQDPLGFASQGVKINTVFLRIFDYWQNQDSSVWKRTESTIMNILRKNPDARLLLDFQTGTNQTWQKQYPDEIWQTKDGKKLREAGYSSEHWRTAGADAIYNLIRSLKKNGFWKIVVGVNFMGGHDGQFWTKVIGEYAADYSPGSLKAWQTYLKANYYDIQTLNSVWNSGYKNFSEIKIPDPTYEHETLPAIMPKGPVPDFRQFCEATAFDLRECFARVVREEAEKDFFVSAYGMPMENQHAYFLKTAGKTGRANNIIASMSYYPYRQPGLASGYHPEQSFGFHNSGFMQELDLRYHACNVGWYDELALMWVGSQTNIADWRNMHRKLTGISLAQNQGYWYYDMEKQFNDKDVQNEIGAVKKIADNLTTKKGVPFKPDVCLVRFSAESRYYGSSVDNAVGATVQWQYMLLETSGVPYDIHYLSDVMAEPSLQQYKIYIIHNNTFLSDKERAWINANLKKNHRIIIWMYDSGYSTEKGLSSQALSELTGMSVKTETAYTRSVAIVAGKDRLAGGEKGYLKIPEFQGMAEALCSIFTTTGPASINKPSFNASFGYVVAPGVSRYQKFWIDGGFDNFLAKYVEDGKIAMAVKRFPDWTSIYIAAPNALAGEMMNNIAKEAGAYRCGQASIGELRMSGRFVSYHAIRSGKYEFQLPKGATKIIDADSGKILSEGSSNYTIDGKAQTTYWYFIE